MQQNSFHSFHRRYQIQETLGKGGMGVVHRAKDRLGSYVALKHLASDWAISSQKIAQSLSLAAQSSEPPTLVRELGNGSAFGNVAISLADVTLADSGAVVDSPLGRPMSSVARSALLHAATLRDANTDVGALLGSKGRAPYSKALAFMQDTSTELRLALAREFQTLASVRHPNIISVLDYGFDENGGPYFTMELLENAETILEAAWKLSQDERFGLLEQMLHAVRYLHRRGIVHRDLKPANVLVQDGRVKVLDFGLALLREQGGDGTLAGTPAYMAPELFCGKSASVASDLYAVGVVVFEVLSGRRLFDIDDAFAVQRAILFTEPDLSLLNDRIAPIVSRLLEKEPKARYQDAAEILRALDEATGQPFSLETAATRESFLQSARLVGRERELSILSKELDSAMLGRGSAWLLGGESGVGKSRLLEELRARAMVAGAAVLRGQEISEGGRPYQLWQDVLRWLVLLSDPSEEEAGALKPLLPDLPALLERDVPELCDLEPQAAQARLMVSVEELLRRLGQPAVMLLEDIHWARSESLKLLARVTSIVSELPLLLIASYRDDERPALPSELPSMNVLKLDRLSHDEIAELSESMIGPAGKRPELLTRLDQETEGNPFFLVEIVRALAEETGQLDRIGTAPLPAKLLPKGMNDIVERRLSRVDPADHKLLITAAVAGRTLDANLLRAAHPDVDLDDRLLQCLNAAVLDISEGQFRFAHDKLREGVLSRLSDAERKSEHLKVALAIVQAYESDPLYYSALAHHFAMAGDRARAAKYCALTGEQALRNSAYREATEFFEKAIALLSAQEDEERNEPKERKERGSNTSIVKSIFSDGISRALFSLLSSRNGRRIEEAAQGHSLQLGQWEGHLSEAYSRLGDHLEGLKHGRAALQYLGLPAPKSALGCGLRLGAEAALLSISSKFGNKIRPPGEAEQARLAEAARIQTRITETCFYTETPMLLLWSGLRALNLGELSGPSPDLARAYIGMGIAAGIMPLHSLAETFCNRALEIADAIDTPYELAWVLQRYGVYRITVAQWEDGEKQLLRAIELGTRSGDRRQWEESMAIVSTLRACQGRFQEALLGFAEVLVSGRLRGDPQTIFWGSFGQAWTMLRLGRSGEAADLLEERRPWVDSAAVLPDAVNCYGMLALASDRIGERVKAGRYAEKALDMLLSKRPVAYWMQPSVTALSETMLGLWERDSAIPANPRSVLGLKAKKACEAGLAFARIFRFAEPSAGLIQGCFERMCGHERQASRLFEQVIARAEELHMPYEWARAKVELARLEPKGSMERDMHLRAALELFNQIGALPDADNTRLLIDG